MKNRMTYRGFKLSLLLGLGMLAGAAQADMQEAREAMNANDYPAAVKALDEVIAGSSDDSKARFLKGLALARSGDTDAALNVFNELSQDRPQMAEAWNNLGVLRARNNKLVSARDALQKAVQLNPDYGPAQENLGDVYVALGRNAYARAADLESENRVVQSKHQQLASFLNNAQSATAGSATSQTASTGGSQSGSAAASAGDDSGDDSGDKRAVRDAINQWAQAWSDQDVQAYLNAYSDDYQPANGQSRSAWASERRERVSAPASINVSLSDMTVRIEGDGEAQATFQQRYESNTYQDQERKRVTLTQEDGGWRILRER